MMKSINKPIKVILNILLVSFMLSLFHCGPAKVPFKEIVWEPIDVVELPTKEDYPQANALYLLDEGEFYVGDYFIFTHHTIIKILNEAGLRYANIHIPFSGENEIHNIKGRTIRKDGTIIELDPENIHEKSLFPEFILYADSKAKVFSMPGAEIGSVIEYSYSVIYKAPFAPAWRFQKDEPILLSSITLIVPQFLHYNYMIASRKDVEVEKLIFADWPLTKAEFKVKNAPAVTEEPFMVPYPEVSSTIYFSLAAFKTIYGTFSIESESWEVSGDRYWGATEEKIKSDNDIKNMTQKLTSGITSESEKIKAIYDFVQSDIRYVAIEIKEGKAIPHKPAEVFKNKYGDCKDKAFLLITMLNDIGVDAYPVLSRTAESGKVIEAFVSRQQFNHAIVALPANYISETEKNECSIVKGEKDYTTADDFLIIDPTSQATPFGQIPWYLENTNALIVKKDESHLITIPKSSGNENRMILECTVTIEEDGTFNCSVTCTRTGQEAIYYRTLLQSLSDSEKREFLERTLARRCHGLILKDYSINELFNLSKPLVLHYTFYIPQYAQKNNGSLTFSPNIFLNSLISILTREKREHTICFDYKKTDIEIIKIKLPKGTHFKAFLEPFETTCSIGKYSYSCNTDGENIILNKQFSINETRIPVEYYHSIKSFFENILISEKKTITLTYK